MHIPESITYHIPNIHPSLLMSWITWVIVGGISVTVASHFSNCPGRLQVLVEQVLKYITNLADEIIGMEKAFRYYALFIGLFLFILTGNLLGLIPGFISPTANPNTTFGLATAVFIYYNAVGIKIHGLRYFRQFMGPSLPWYMFPIKVLFLATEVMSLFVKPFSLGLRLFCNIFSKEILLQVLVVLLLQFISSSVPFEKCFSSAPLFLRPAILLLGVVISFIQALVFTVLSISYVGGAVHAGEH